MRMKILCFSLGACVLALSLSTLANAQEFEPTGKYAEKPFLESKTAKDFTPAAESTEVDIEQCAVKIKHKTGSGSGVNVREGVLTCFHVVQGQPQVEVTCQDEIASATVSVADSQSDVALLKVVWKKAHPRAEIADALPVVCDKMKTVGRSKDGTLTVEEHECIATPTGEVRFANPLVSGRSGCGLFFRGRLVGIGCGNIVATEPYIGFAADVVRVKRVTTKSVTVSTPSPAAVQKPPAQSNCPGGVCPITPASSYSPQRRIRLFR